MKKVIFILLSILVSICAQAQTNRLAELEQMIRIENGDFPLVVENGKIGNCTITKTYIEGDFYVIDFVIDSPVSFSNLMSNKKVMKQNTYKALKSDPQFVYTANLLIDCNKELKYKYISKMHGHVLEIIITRKDLKKLVG